MAGTERLTGFLRQLRRHPGRTLGGVAAQIGHSIQKPVRRIRRLYIRRVTPVDPHRIAIMTNTCTYTCNPKYIYEEIRRRNLPYDIVWIIDDKRKKKDYPKDVRTVRLYTDACTRAVYGSKIWLDNGIAFSTYFEKKPGQLHLQTMHGSLGIKRLDNAVAARNQRGRSGQQIVRRESTLTDAVFTNSAFEEGVFRQVFWKDTPMLRLGHARTDVLFRTKEEDEGFIREIRERLEKQYGIPADKKIVLYAPTHRRGMKLEDLITDYERLNRAFSERFGGEFVTLIRFHSRTKDIAFRADRIPGVYDVSRYPDIQELMLAADAGITDYSSWIFDYVLTRKPGFLYATDQDNYENKTGLCYPLTETPFPVSADFETLLSQIASFRQEPFEERVEAFLNEKESVDDGHSAERIVDWIVRQAPPA